MKTILLCFLIIFLTFKQSNSTMTETQVKSAGKMLRNVCQPKTKVTNAQIEVMHKGEFTEDNDIMCYMECILRMGQIMKDAKLNLESVRTQMANLPPQMAKVASAALEGCKDSVKSNDKCMGAYELYKCLYEQNPENFFLP